MICFPLALDALSMRGVVGFLAALLFLLLTRPILSESLPSAAAQGSMVLLEDALGISAAGHYSLLPTGSMLAQTGALAFSLALAGGIHRAAWPGMRMQRAASEDTTAEALDVSPMNTGQVSLEEALAVEYEGFVAACCQDPFALSRVQSAADLCTREFDLALAGQHAAAVEQEYADTMDQEYDRHFEHLLEGCCAAFE